MMANALFFFGGGRNARAKTKRIVPSLSPTKNIFTKMGQRLKVILVIKTETISKIAV